MSRIQGLPRLTCILKKKGGLENSLKEKMLNKSMASRHKLRTSRHKNDYKDKPEKDKPVKRHARNLKGHN